MPPTVCLLIRHIAESQSVASAGVVQVDRVLAFSALTQRDLEAIFGLLLESQNQQRRRRHYQLALPRHERLLLQWDGAVLAALARDPRAGGYSGAFARHGAAKCLEVLEQALDELEAVQCGDDDHVYVLRAPAAPRQPLRISCKAAEQRPVRGAEL